MSNESKEEPITRLVVGPFVVEESQDAYRIHLADHPDALPQLIVKPSSGSESLVHSLVQEMKRLRETLVSVTDAWRQASELLDTARSVVSFVDSANRWPEQSPTPDEKWWLELDFEEDEPDYEMGL